MPGFPPLSQSFPKTYIIGIPIQAAFAAISIAGLRRRTSRNLCPLGLAAKLFGAPDELRQGGCPGSRESAFLASARPSRRRGPFRIRRHVARNAGGIWTGSAGTRRDAVGSGIRSAVLPGMHRAHRHEFPGPAPPRIRSRKPWLSGRRRLTCSSTSGSRQVSMLARNRSTRTSRPEFGRTSSVIFKGRTAARSAAARNPRRVANPDQAGMRLLGRKGLMRRGEGRGCMVLNPAVEGTFQAVEVRGLLESLVAQEPGRRDQLPTMQKAMERLDASISEPSRPDQLNGHVTRQAQAAWSFSLRSPVFVLAVSSDPCPWHHLRSSSQSGRRAALPCRSF